MLLIWGTVSYFLYSFFNLTDDTYIYLTYARNFIESGELSFNKGDLTYGFTSPLWLALIIILSPIFKNILLIPTFLSISFAIAYLLLWWRIINLEEINFKHKLLFFTIISLDPNLVKHAYTGLETTAVYFFSLLLLYYFILRNRKNNNSVFIGILIGLAYLVRPDLMLFIVILFLFNYKSVFSNKNAISILISLIIIVPWLIFSKMYFGGFFPSTFYAKGADYPIGRYFVTNLVSSFSILSITYFAPLVILILKMITQRKDSLSATSNNYNLTLIALTLSYILFYSLTISNEFVFSRYFSMLFPAFFLALLFSLRIMPTGKKFNISAKAYYLIPIYFLIVSFLHSTFYKAIYRDSELTENKIIAWVNDNTTSEDHVYRDRIGKIAFLTNRYIVDPVGIINKDISKYKLNNEVAIYYKKKNTSVFINPHKSDFLAIQKKFPNSIVLLDSFPSMGKSLVRQSLIERLKQNESNVAYNKIYRVNW